MDKKISLDSPSIRTENTGSVEFQISRLTTRVSKLTSHLKLHSKDYSSQRGLWKILGKRKRLLGYLAENDPIWYEDLIGNLGIRGLKGVDSIS